LRKPYPSDIRKNLITSTEGIEMASDDKELTTYEISRDISRGSAFLGTLSRAPHIRRILAERGYTNEVHQTGWSYYLEVMGWRPEPVPVVGVSELEQERAIVELDQWDGPNFTIARAALHHLHPAQEIYVFDNLVAAQGAAAVGTVKTYLTRVQALRDGTDPNRTSTREGDRAAVATLETRKVAGAELERHLMGLIETATTAAPIAPEPEEDPGEYQQAAGRLHAWLTDWRETARAVITRRDYLIRLGLVTRKGGKVVEEVEDVLEGEETE
jgi:hypothetical protein